MIEEVLDCAENKDKAKLTLEIIQKATHEDPEKRFNSVKEITELI